jgi:hypothetical protein
MQDPEQHIPNVEERYAEDIDFISHNRHVLRAIRVIDIEERILKDSTGQTITSDTENRRWIDTSYASQNRPVPPWDVITVGLIKAKEVLLDEMKSRGQA